MKWTINKKRTIGFTGIGIIGQYIEHNFKIVGTSHNTQTQTGGEMIPYPRFCVMCVSCVFCAGHIGNTRGTSQTQNKMCHIDSLLYCQKQAK